MTAVGTRILVIDPPWEYRSRHETRKDNPTKKSRFGVGASGRYSVGVMSEEALIDMAKGIRGICAEDVYCFSWTVRPSLAMGLRVLEGWGFEYKQMPLSWEKTYPSEETFKGTGRYTFGNLEDMLLGRYPGTRCWHSNTGYRPQMLHRTVHPRYLQDPYGREDAHSIKPEVFQDELEKWLDPYIEEGLKVELFATRRRPGWICLGFDVTQRLIHEDLAILNALLDLGCSFEEIERRIYRS